MVEKRRSSLPLDHCGERNRRVTFIITGLAMLLLSITSADAGVNTWTTTGPSGQSVYALAVDPNNPATIYAGTDGGGVYKSTNGGVNWAKMNTGLLNLSVNALAIDPIASATIYAGTNGGAYKSTNGGGNWAAVNTGLSSQSVYSLAVDPATPSILYAGTFTHIGGVFKSTDGGNSWTEYTIGWLDAVVRNIVIDPATPSTLYAGTSSYDGTVFKSTNGGENWVAVNTGMTAPNVTALAIDPRTPSTIYAGTNEGGVFRSTNGGAGWSAINSGLTNLHISSLAIDPVEPMTLYAGARAYSGGIYKSTNGGASWTAMIPGLSAPFVWTLAIDPAAPLTLYAGIYGVYQIMMQPAIVVTDSVAPNNDHAIPFGTKLLGSSTDQTITTNNAGYAHLLISSIASLDTLAAPFSIATDSCSGRALAPAESCLATVRFTPVTAGIESDSFDVASNDPAAPSITVSVGGTGATELLPDIVVFDSVPPDNDHQLGFGSVLLGSSAAQVVMIRNTGFGVLNVSNIGLSGTDANHYLLSLTTGTSSCNSVSPSIDAGGECTVTVWFLPLTAGAKNATLTITSNDPDTQSVMLGVSGTGMPLIPKIVVTDSVYPINDHQVTYGNVYLGNTVQQVVTISNTGAIALSVNNIQLANTASQFTLSVTGGPPLCDGTAPSVRPGESCIVVITFHPLSAEVYSSTLTITSDDPDTPVVTIALSGTGAQPSQENPPTGGGASSFGPNFGDINFCFIATAAYGSHLDPHVQALRDFRDNYLLTNRAGRAFVDMYYRYAPPVAEFVAMHEHARFVARLFLTPIVYAVRYPFFAGMMILLCARGLLAIKKYHLDHGN